MTLNSEMDGRIRMMAAQAFPFHEAWVRILQFHGICVCHGSGVMELGWRERSFDGFKNIKLAFCRLRFSSGV